MKTRLLLHCHFKLVGIILLIISFGLLYIYQKYGLELPFLAISPKPDLTTSLLTNDLTNNHNYTDEIIYFLLFVSLIIIAFSKEKQEDEYIDYLRLETLLISLYISFLIYVIELFFLFGLVFIYISLINFYAFLIAYIGIFNTRLYILNKKKANNYDE